MQEFETTTPPARALQSAGVGWFEIHVPSRSARLCKSLAAALGESGATMSFNDFVEATAGESAERSLTPLMRGSATECRFEFELRGSDRLRWIRCVASRDVGAPVVTGVTIDCTAERAAEVERIECETRFREAFAAAKLVASTCDADLRYTWIQNAHRRFGDVHVLGRRDTEIADNEGTRALEALKRRVLISGRPETQTIGFPLGTEVREYEVYARPLLARPGGSIVGVGTTATDVTERNAAERRLRSSADTFYHLVQNNPFGVYVVDADFRLRQVSRGSQKVFSGINPLIGRDFAEVLRIVWKEPFATQAIERFRHTLSTGEPYASPRTVEERADHGIVEAYDWRIERISLPEGRFGVVCYFYDLSDRQAWERQVRESEARFRTMADAAPVIVRVTGANAACTFMSKSWESLTGQSTDDGLGSGWLERVHPEDRAVVWRTMSDAHDAQLRFAHEYRLLNAAGDVRWVLDTAVPRMDGTAFEGTIGSLLDITERRAAEHALRDADRKKDAFLAMLSHELRNPLAPVRMAAQLLTLPQIDSDQVASAVDVIQRHVGHMAELLDSLLDVSRITNGRLELRRRTVDLREVLRTAIEMCQARFAKRGVSLEYIAPAHSVPLFADAARLAQAVSAILDNAAKFSSASAPVYLRVAVMPERVTIEVVDHGVGMSDEALASAFELFSTGDRPIGSGEGGLGVGLALAKAIVELHGGRVTAASAGRDRGSRVTIDLPAQLTSAVSVPSDPAAPPTVADARALRILVVDDNVDAADTTSMLLKSAGFSVRTAYDGEAAVAAVLKDAPDVVVLDIGMPVMDGYAVAKRLRAVCAAPPRLLALTGWGQEADLKRAREAGFEMHLTKPVEPEVLLRAVTRLVGSRPDN